MKYTKLLLLVAALALTVGCGSSAKTVGNPPGQPLDPQGNWLFIFTGTNGTAPDLEFAGQLYELVSPVVTGNEMPNVMPRTSFGFNCGGVTLHGQASGTNSIGLTGVETDRAGQPSFALTGTVAVDQAHMTGTWTGTGTCTDDGLESGTWTAQAIPAVTGTWTGTVSGVSVSATVTENTDQTSATMGQLTGTVSVSGSPCIVSGTYSLGPYPSNVHFAESVLVSVTDANNTELSGSFTVDPTTAPNSATGNVTYVGGPCDGQSFPFALTLQ